MGAWQSGDHAGGPALPSGKRMHYNVLLPAGWSKTGGPYTLLVDEHELDQGNPWYARGQDDLPTRGGADGWYNNAAFQDAYGPVVVLLPHCDETTDPGGSVQNFGGWSGAGAQPVNFMAVLALVTWAIQAWNIDRVLITGRSLGGIGTEAAMLWASVENGTAAKLFTAGLSFAGVIETYARPLPADVIALMGKVKLFAVSGANDTTSRPQDFNQPLWDALCAANDAPGLVGKYPAYPGAQAGTSEFHYLQAPGMGHDVWDTYMTLPLGKPLWDWLFSQRAGAPVTTPVLTPSPDRTVIKSGSTAAIIDTVGAVWTITSIGQIAVNGVVDVATSNVVEIALCSGVMWQLNAAGNWYSKASGAAAWSPPTMVNPIMPGFSVHGGRIYDPAGNSWTAEGINARPADPASATQILALFPGITFVRIALGSFAAPGLWNSFITTMEAAHVVCEVEYHPWPLQPALTGTALATEIAWAASWARYYKSRPYVWIGSMNEPQSGSMTPEHVALYNAVRAVDPTKMIMLVGGIGGGNPGAVGTGSLTASAYATMTNIVWDLHFYGWSIKSNDQGAVSAGLLGSVASHSGILAAQAIPSADGAVPVIIGEFGPSTSGAANDPNASQVIAAVLGSTRTAGWVGWAWNADPYNALQKGGTARTAWGDQLAADMVASPPPPPPPPPPPLAVTVEIPAAGTNLLTLVLQPK